MIHLVSQGILEAEEILCMVGMRKGVGEATMTGNHCRTHALVARIESLLWKVPQVDLASIQANGQVHPSIVVLVVHQQKKK
jgi:hypothetical protein